jgi:hypothetical protein
MSKGQKRHNPEKRGRKWYGKSYKKGGEKISDLRERSVAQIEERQSGGLEAAVAESATPTRKV